MRRADVLIETSCNVKSDMFYLLQRLSTVLIETSWNVKVDFKQVFTSWNESINRNIVECKDQSIGIFT